MPRAQVLEGRALLSTVELVHDTGIPTDLITDNPTVVWDSTGAADVNTQAAILFEFTSLNDQFMGSVTQVVAPPDFATTKYYGHPVPAWQESGRPGSPPFGHYLVKVMVDRLSTPDITYAQIGDLRYWWVANARDLPFFIPQSITATKAEGTYSNEVFKTFTLNAGGYSLSNLSLALEADDDGQAAPAGQESGEFTDFSVIEVASDITANTKTFELRFTGVLDYEGIGAASDHKRTFDLRIYDGVTALPDSLEADVEVTITDVTPTADATLSINSNILSGMWSSTKTPATFDYMFERWMNSAWTNVSSMNGVSATQATFDAGTNYGKYRLSVRATWTAAGNNDISAWDPSNEVIYNRPLNQPPKLTTENLSLNITACGSLTTTSVTDPLTDPDKFPWVSDDTTPLNDLQFVVTPVSADNPTFAAFPTVEIILDGNPAYKILKVTPTVGGARGTFTYKMKVTDKDGASSPEMTFTVTISNELLDPAVPVIIAPTSSTFVLASGSSSQSITVDWNAAANAVSYDWEVHKWGVAANGISVELQKIDSGTTTATELTRTYGPGAYEFWVRAENCITEESDWARTSFMVASPTSLSKIGSSEDQCGCHQEDPSHSVDDNSAVSHNSGDLSVTATLPQSASFDGPLGGFVVPIYQSESNPHPVVNVRIPMSTLPTSVSVQLFSDSGFSNPLSSAKNLTSAQMGIGVVGKIMDVPVQFNGSALPTGIQGLSARVQLTYPGPNGSSVTRTIDLVGQKLAIQNNLASDFGRRFSMAGADRLFVDSSGASLLRGTGTSVFFQGTVGTGYTTPTGAFSKLAVSAGIYTVTSAIGEKRTYEADPSDATGNRYLITSSISPEGMTTQMLWENLDSDPERELSKVTFVPTGAEVRYVYMANRLSEVRYDSDGAGSGLALVWNYAFSASNNLLMSITGPASGVAGEARPVTKFTYYPDQPTNPDLPSFLLESMEFTDTANSPGEKTAYGFDIYANVTSITQIGDSSTTGDDRVWTFSMAESRQLAGTAVEVQGASVADIITLPDSSVITQTSDDFGNILSQQQTVIGALGETITVQYERNMHGQITKMTVPNVGSLAAYEIVNAYDDGDGVTDTNTADDKFLVRTEYPDGTYEAYTYNASSPKVTQPTTFRDRIGRIATYAYNAQGLRTSVSFASTLGLISDQFASWSGPLLQWTVLPDPNGNPTAGQSGTTRPAVAYVYDSRNRLIHTRYTSATGSGSSWTIAAASTSDVWVSQDYDYSFGNLAWITMRYQPSTLTGGLPTSVPVSVKTNFTNDSRGNVRAMLLPDPDNADGIGRPDYTFTYGAWDETLKSVVPGTTAESLRSTTETYNRFGELLTTTLPDPDGGGSLTPTVITDTYDKLGQLKKSTAADTTGALTQWFYAFDSLGRLRSESVALPGAATSAAIREQTFFQYDAFGRITRVEEPDATVSGTASSFKRTDIIYDDKNRQIRTKRYLSADFRQYVDSDTRFDAIGRVVAEFTADPDGTATGNPSLGTIYDYTDGNTTYGNRGTLVRTTDSRGVPSWAKYGPSGQFLVSETSDPDGPENPDGTGSLLAYFQTAAYNGMGELTATSDRYGASFSSPTGIRTTTYGRNVRGQVTDTVTPDPDGTGSLKALAQRNQYDNLGRLTLETIAFVATVDAQGVPTAFTNISGTEYQYRSDSLVSAELRRDKNGALDRTLSYNYDNLGRTSSVVTPDGTTNYTYDRWGNLWKITRPQVSSPAGNHYPYIEYLYSTTTAGQFLSETRAPWSAGTTTGTEITKYDSDLAGRVIKQFSANPAADAALTAATRQWSYDKLDRLTAETNGLANTITYTWDGLSRPVSASGGTRTQVWTWAVNGDLQSVTSPDGRISSFRYDNWGRVVDENRLTDGVDTDTIPETIYSTNRTVYDNYGRIRSVTEGVGQSYAQTTSFVYDALDRLTTRTNALNGQQLTYFDDRGFVKQVNNEYSQPQYFEYDDFGRLKSMWDYQNSDAKTTYSYDNMDHVDSVTRPQTKVGSTVTFATTSYLQDALGRTTSKTDSLNGVTAYAYDRAGNLASLTDSEGNLTRWEYDRRDRLQYEQIMIPVGGVSTEVVRENQYDNADNVVWTKDRNDRWKQLSYSFAFGADDNYRLDQESWWQAGVYSNRIKYAYSEGNGLRLTSVTDQNLETSPTAVYSQIEFAYDDLGRMTLKRDRLDPTTTPSTSELFDLSYTLNAVDQRTATVGRFRQFPSGQPSTSQWDATMYHVWDKLNRVTSVQQITSLDPANATWSTDTMKTKTVALEYYANSALKKLTRTQGSGSNASTTLLVTDYVQQNPEWWYAGQVAIIKHSGFDGGESQNRSMEYDFDVAGRVSQTRELLGTTNTTLLDLDTRVFAYDTTSQVTSVTSTRGSAESYSYDDNGNRIAVVQASSQSTYVTGTFNRLSDDGTYTYLYDKEGNRTRRDNKVQPPVGDFVTVWFETYAWDFRNRLTTVTKFDRYGTTLETIRYEYDGLDHKTRKIVTIPGQIPPTAQERYLYDRNILSSSLLPRFGGEGGRRPDEGASSEVLLVINELASGSATYQKVTHRFLNGPEIDQVFSDETNGGILWYLQDRQNTVRDVATWDGHGDATKEWKVVNHISYDSFGNVTGWDDPTTTGADTNGKPGSDTANAPRRSYTGREPDSHTGLIYYRARWFDAKIGRFISEDPIGFTAGDANLSRYVGNNSPNAVDPSGLNPNKKGVRSLQQFEDDIAKDAEASLSLWYESWQGDDIAAARRIADFLAALLKMQLEDEDAGSNHFYAYSPVDDRWIDIRHLASAGYWRENFMGCVGDDIVMIGGFGVEVWQGLRSAYNYWGEAGDAGSAYGVEDAYSNARGVEFFDWAKPILSKRLAERRKASNYNKDAPIDLSVADLFIEYLRLKGVNDPTTAPRYADLPPTEGHWQVWRYQYKAYRNTMEEVCGAMVKRKDYDIHDGNWYLYPSSDERLPKNKRPFEMDEDEDGEVTFVLPPIQK